MDLPIVAGVEFRAIPGFEGYAVGDDGSVWWCLRKGTRGGRFWSWRPKKPTRSSNGYWRVHLSSGGKKTTLSVHRLVLTAFVREPVDGEYGCHFPDIDKSNNRLKNLRWDTQKGNMSDRDLLGNTQKGERHYKAKLTYELVRTIRAEAMHFGASELARRHGIARSTIAHVIARHTWKDVGEVIT